MVSLTTPAFILIAVVVFIVGMGAGFSFIYFMNKLSK